MADPKCTLPCSPLMPSGLGALPPQVVGKAQVVGPLAAGTRIYDWSGTVVTDVSTTSTVAVALPAAGATGEIMLQASSACALIFGDAAVGAAVLATSPLRMETGERFHFRPKVDQTHFRAIGEVPGALRATPVV